MNPRLLSLVSDFPPHSVSPPETKEFLASLKLPNDPPRAGELVDESGIRSRRTIAPLRELARLGTVGARNDAYATNALLLAGRVAADALAKAGLDPATVTTLVVSSSTGYMVPGLGERLASLLRLRRGVRTLPLSGLGCAGGIRGIGLAADLLRGQEQGAAALVVAVEVCSVWLQGEEPSVEDILAAANFGDGAAAAVIANAESGSELVASRSELWAGCAQARGARLTEGGLRHFSSSALPRLVHRRLRPAIDEFLTSLDLREEDIGFWAIGASDYRLLGSAQSALQLSPAQLARSCDVWESRGNTLSTGALLVLESPDASLPETLALAIAFGPGISCDLLLTRSPNDATETACRN